MIALLVVNEDEGTHLFLTDAPGNRYGWSEELSKAKRFSRRDAIRVLLYNLIDEKWPAGARFEFVSAA